MIRKEKTSNSFPRKPPLVSRLSPESVLQTILYSLFTIQQFTISLIVSFLSQSPKSYHVQFIYSAQMWGHYPEILPCFLQSPGLPEALSYVCFIWLPLISCCHSFWTLLDCLYILTALFVVLQAYYPALCLTSAASAPSRLILLSRVYVYCRWLVCHRHVVTASLPSPQSVLWSAACNHLSIWYFNHSHIFVSFWILFDHLHLVCVLDKSVNAARNQPQLLCKLISVLKVNWNRINIQRFFFFFFVVWVLEVYFSLIFSKGTSEN